jgi:hypothetical protein
MASSFMISANNYETGLYKDLPAEWPALHDRVSFSIAMIITFTLKNKHPCILIFTETTTNFPTHDHVIVSHIFHLLFVALQDIPVLKIPPPHIFPENSPLIFIIFHNFHYHHF